MSPTEKADIRKVWITLITAIGVMVVSYIFGIPERISGVSRKIDILEQTKMNKDDARTYFNELQTLMASQCAKWDQYMISNENDKIQILKDIEIIQSDIKDLLSKKVTVTRSVAPTQTQSTGGKAVK